MTHALYSGASAQNVADLIMLSEISEESIINNLSNRLRAELIYTFVGSVLISVNPYKMLPIYGKSNINKYRGKQIQEVPPHVYSIAEAAYKSLLYEHQDQSIIISGESGSGKTEASKRIMEYIAAVSVGNGERVEHVKNIFLESNPLLEAFGNAKTVRNDNSSRFGKYMQMQFTVSGEPIGGRIWNYLLEKSRLVNVSAGERVFHIFYQLLAGATAQQKSTLHLTEPADYAYLNASGTYEIDGKSDAKEFKETLHAMDVVGVTKEEQDQIMHVIAAILHIGNIQFVEGDGGSAQVADMALVELVADILKCEVGPLQQALVSRTVQSVGRQSKYSKPLNVEEATYTRDALAKGMYGRLFDWLVQKINQAIETEEYGYLIGVLDIYGFEILEKNSFEQLLINFVNEKLQQIFIELTLKAEQEEYVKEEIEWEEVAYENNIKCVELIENRMGMFSLLDEESLFPRGTDLTFLNKINQRLADNPHFVKPDLKKHPNLPRNNFLVKHYAGEVVYDVEGFLDKNKDLFFNDLKLALMNTGLSFLKELIPELTMDEKQKRPSTLSTQFKKQVADLMKALYSCKPHYVRCIKPNSGKKAIFAEQKLMQTQVKYLGLYENVRVRRAGFCYRAEFDRFLNRFKMLTKETWPHFAGSAIDGCKCILQHVNLKDPNLFQFGKTKLFIRQPEWIYELEEQRLRRLDDLVRLIQKEWRAHKMRKYLAELKQASMGVYEGDKDRRRQSIQPKFRGDALHLGDNVAIKTMVEGNGDGQVLFSAQVRKLNRSLKFQLRIIMITEGAIYNLGPAKKGKYSFKRRIPLNIIDSIRLSKLIDGYVVARTDGSVFDWVVEVSEKTELITVLRDTVAKKQDRELPLVCENEIQITLRKGKRSALTFAYGGVNAAKKAGGKVNIMVDESNKATDEDWSSAI